MIVISRNFKFILNKLNCLIGIELLCCLCLFYFIDFSYIISIILGLFFSFLIILDFAVSEYAILHGGKKGAFFLFYLSRLFLYAILSKLSPVNLLIFLSGLVIIFLDPAQ